MTNPNELTAQQTEVRRIRRVLRQMHQLAENSSLTGTLSGGAPEVAETYNRIHRYLTEQSVLSTNLFPSLPADASFERAGVAAKLLEGYLAEDAGSDIRVTLPPIQPQLDELRDIGRTIRDNLPDFLKRKMETRLDRLERAEQEAREKEERPEMPQQVSAEPSVFGER